MVKVCTDRFFTKMNGMRLRTPGYYLDKNLKANIDNYVIKAIAKKHDALILMTGLEGCLAGTVKIKTGNGDKNIKDFKDVETVVAYDFKNKKYIDTIAFKVKSGVKETYEIKFKSGKIIIATLDHKFFVKDINGEVVEKRLKDIVNGDKLLCQR